MDEYKELMRQADALRDQNNREEQRCQLSVHQYRLRLQEATRAEKAELAKTMTYWLAEQALKTTKDSAVRQIQQTLLKEIERRQDQLLAGADLLGRDLRTFGASLDPQTAIREYATQWAVQGPQIARIQEGEIKTLGGIVRSHERNWERATGSIERRPSPLLQVYEAQWGHDGYYGEVLGIGDGQVGNFYLAAAQAVSAQRAGEQAVERGRSPMAPQLVDATQPAQRIQASQLPPSVQPAQPSNDQRFVGPWHCKGGNYTLVLGPNNSGRRIYDESREFNGQGPYWLRIDRLQMWTWKQQGDTGEVELEAFSRDGSRSWRDHLRFRLEDRSEMLISEDRIQEGERTNSTYTCSRGNP